MRKTTAMIAGLGAAIGAGVMYLMDPAKGRRRRALVGDKLNSAGHAAADAVTRTGRDAKNRAKGLLHENKQRLAGEEVPDDVLVQRVRSEMGHVIDKPQDVTVTALGGRVTLDGTVAEGKVDDLVDRVEKMPGVAGVENRLSAVPASVVGKDAGAKKGKKGTEAKGVEVH